MRYLAALALAAILLSGCGDDNASEPTTVPTPELGLPEAEEARTCLTDAGFRVLGGPSSPTDRDAPDVELTFSADPVQVFVALYRDSARAARFEPEVRRNTERFGGVVERRGSVIIVWSAPPSPDSRESVRRCAFAT